LSVCLLYTHICDQGVGPCPANHRGELYERYTDYNFQLSESFPLSISPATELLLPAGKLLSCNAKNSVLQMGAYSNTLGTDGLGTNM